VILPNCRDSAALSHQKALASQWVGIGLSLIKEQGDHHSIAGNGRFRNTALVFFGDISSMSASGLFSDIDAWPADVAD
jgi:hypothetical protein